MAVLMVGFLVMFIAIFAGVKEIQSPVHVRMRRRSRLCVNTTKLTGIGLGRGDEVPFWKYLGTFSYFA
jgi:hypothetical protein